MKLNVNNDQLVDAPSIDLIRQSIDELLPEKFVVLAKSEHEYIQVCQNPDRTFQLEYRAGSEVEHFEAVKLPCIDDVKQAFIRYADGMPNWETPWDWQKLNLDA